MTFPLLRKKKGKMAKKDTVKKPSVSQVRKMINRSLEHKYQDVLLDISSSAVPTYYDLTFMSLGTGDNANRVGDEVIMKSLEFKYQVTNADNTNVLRIVIVQYKEDTLVSSPSDLFDVSGISTTTQSPVIPNVPYKYDAIKKGKYKVLSDRRYAVGNAGPNVLTGTVRKYWKNGLKLRFTDPADGPGAFALTGMNKIFMYVFSDSTISAHPRISGINRIIYTDA